LIQRDMGILIRCQLMRPLSSCGSQDQLTVMSPSLLGAPSSVALAACAPEIPDLMCSLVLMSAYMWPQPGLPNDFPNGLLLPSLAWI